MTFEAVLNQSVGQALSLTIALKRMFTFSLLQHQMTFQSDSLPAGRPG